MYKRQQLEGGIKHCVNRLFGDDKPHGTICYFRKPHTMEQNIEDAVRLYSGDRPIGLFVERLPGNVERMNASFAEISSIFKAAGIQDFKKLPDDHTERAAFASHFQQFSSILEAAKIQGFSWDKAEYSTEDGSMTVTLEVSRQQYLTLLQRYKELGSGGSSGGAAIPFDISSRITAIDTGKIDADYMNSRFEKYLKELDAADEQARESTLSELQRSFSSLSQEEQKHAEILLRDIHRGDLQIDASRTFRDYLADYQAKAQNEEVAAIVEILGVDENKLIALMNINATEATLNEYGRFDELKATVDKRKAKAYFEELTDEKLSPAKVNIRAATLLRRFLLDGDVSEIARTV